MRALRYAFGILAISALVAGGVAKSREAGSVAGRVSGEAVVLAPGARAMERDASRIVVWLVPLDAVMPVRAATERPHYRLSQRNKRFDPDMLVVPVGNVVDFPNGDPWFHSALSLYRRNRF